MILRSFGRLEIQPGGSLSPLSYVWFSLLVGKFLCDNLKLILVIPCYIHSQSHLTTGLLTQRGIELWLGKPGN